MRYMRQRTVSVFVRIVIVLDIMFPPIRGKAITYTILNNGTPTQNALSTFNLHVFCEELNFELISILFQGGMSHFIDSSGPVITLNGTRDLRTTYS